MQHRLRHSLLSFSIRDFLFAFTIYAFASRFPAQTLLCLLEVHHPSMNRNWQGRVIIILAIPVLAPIPAAPQNKCTCDRFFHQLPSHCQETSQWQDSLQLLPHSLTRNQSREARMQTTPPLQAAPLITSKSSTSPWYVRRPYLPTPFPILKKPRSSSASHPVRQLTTTTTIITLCPRNPTTHKVEFLWPTITRGKDCSVATGNLNWGSSASLSPSPGDMTTNVSQSLGLN